MRDYLHKDPIKDNFSSSNNDSNYLTKSVRMPIPQPRTFRIRRQYPLTLIMLLIIIE